MADTPSLQDLDGWEFGSTVQPHFSRENLVPGAQGPLHSTVVVTVAQHRGSHTAPEVAF